MLKRLYLLPFILLVVAISCAPRSESPTAEPPQASVQVLGPEFGFASEEHLREHYSKHGSEFGSITQSEYLSRARILRDAPVGGPILQIIRADEARTRFDQRSGDFIAFGQDLTILTFFSPRDGERYFKRQATRPH
ncbi:MAG: hypothetical protein ABL949_14345 [Fimbriimonadaceae bacterium]